MDHASKTQEVFERGYSQPGTLGGILKCTVVLFLLSCLAPSSLQAQAMSRGQTVYVPAYSHIYSGDRELPFLLTVTLSIRNIDPSSEIRILAVDYFETQGELLTKELKRPVDLKPLGSIRYVIPETDEAGGSGANFLVQWTSDRPVNPPIIESVMIGTRQQQGISFVSRGRAIVSQEIREKAED